ncbi:DUF1992 domain-containing protein [Amycolatopsis thermalba]|uniref:DUF1992 domain-containing protein n=1 Tax=Amycolatopsis thermalba TaxID=944492 RepID=A0ABY4P2P2_9PSEU|nr:MULTISPECIES: DUF1992 domain-containing protein [Amycolatopsis]OXM73634.1 molecular chaperone DnaJ [Amycolatopsis sp. KNN50.9b]UQS26553.1 DUF1992 domain-containing protein [Amycolatopsis thermalba]
MTERKPPDVSFETWVEKQIREAAERGEFENLPGAGKPLAWLKKPHDENAWLREKLARENITYLPPSLALRKEAAQARAAAGAADSEAEVRRILTEINERIVAAIRRPPPGPPLNLAPFDVEHIVAEWRAGHASSGGH